MSIGESDYHKQASSYKRWRRKIKSEPLNVLRTLQKMICFSTAYFQRWELIKLYMTIWPNLFFKKWRPQVLKKRKSYDDEKPAVKMYVKIWLLIAFSAVLATCTSIFHDTLEHFLYSKEINIFRYHKWYHLFKKIESSFFAWNMTASLCGKVGVIY